MTRGPVSTLPYSILLDLENNLVAWFANRPGRNSWAPGSCDAEATDPLARFVHNTMALAGTLVVVAACYLAMALGLNIVVNLKDQSDPDRL
jgi:hypothetical protein